MFSDLSITVNSCYEDRLRKQLFCLSSELRIPGGMLVFIQNPVDILTAFYRLLRCLYAFIVICIYRLQSKAISSNRIHNLT